MIQRWRTNLLSNADKEILIKVVAQIIPINAMSIFKLPLLAALWPHNQSKEHELAYFSQVPAQPSDFFSLMWQEMEHDDAELELLIALAWKLETMAEQKW